MNRSPLQGVRTVVRFNWPLYAAALLVLAAALVGTLTLLPAPAGWLAALIAAGACWFLVGSLGATHWIYDRSDLYRWAWLRKLAPTSSFRLLVCHTGFDEVSESLHHHFPRALIETLDHFDPSSMTEASIRRARALHPPSGKTLAAPFDQWPALEADLILAPLSIHELRTIEERTAWFRQARQALAPQGRIILVEHLRDLANFLAFGPGFVHFHSEKAWRASWTAAGLTLDHSFRLTPFVRVFVLK